MSSMFTYSPQDIILTIDNYQISDLISVIVKWDVETFKVVKGIHGQNTRVFNADTGCTISVNLLQTSISNDVLSYIATLDYLMTRIGFSVSLKDAAGSSLIISNNAFVQTLPAAEFSDSFQHRTWEIVCLDTSIRQVGGNYLSSKAITLFS